MSITIDGKTGEIIEETSDALVIHKPKQKTDADILEALLPIVKLAAYFILRGGK